MGCLSILIFRQVWTAGQLMGACFYSWAFDSVEFTCLNRVVGPSMNTFDLLYSPYTSFTLAPAATGLRWCWPASLTVPGKLPAPPRGWCGSVCRWRQPRMKSSRRGRRWSHRRGRWAACPAGSSPQAALGTWPAGRPRPAGPDPGWAGSERVYDRPGRSRSPAQAPPAGPQRSLPDWCTGSSGLSGSPPPSGKQKKILRNDGIMFTNLSWVERLYTAGLCLRRDKCVLVAHEVLGLLN